MTKKDRFQGVVVIRGLSSDVFNVPDVALIRNLRRFVLFELLLNDA